MTQLQIHKKIDDFFKAGMPTASVEVAHELVNNNEDAKRYFFTKSDETWLTWIWKNNLLASLKDKAKDATTYSYRLSELEYLTRMAEKQPKLVADIIVSILISKETFNPEVVDRFLWITGLLPAEQIELILPKILKENWVQLMANFGRSGYEYQKMIEKLKEAKAHSALVILAQIILTLRTKEELDAIEGYFISGKLFYLHDITETGIFEALLDVNSTENEKTLKVVLDVLSKAVTLGKDREEMVFAEAEPFYLLDVDLFTVELSTNRRSYSKDDIENLIATAKKLAEGLFILSRENEAESRRLYTAYISTLPDSRTLYRLRLFAVTRSPSFFKAEIKDLLFRVFNVGERYFEIEGGAEYHSALIAGFGVLDEAVKREYIKSTLRYFGATLGDIDKESWRKRDGLTILQYIKNELTEKELTDAEALLGKFPEGDVPVPHPDSSGVTGGTVTHLSPFKLTDYTVPDIIVHLKTDWAPEVLSEQFKNDSFRNPRGVEGLGDALKEDLKSRTAEYFTNLNGFFDRKSIHPNYVYSLLRGIEEMQREKKVLNDEQCIQVLGFFNMIRTSGEEKEFERSDEKSWLGDWITAHQVIAEILLALLALLKDSVVFKQNRPSISLIVRYLLSIKSSPNVEDVERESEEPSVVALNSVRGQAFRALVQLAYNDGNESLSDDVKVLYEHILDNDTSNAIRFSIGQFFASFYFRDIPYMTNLLPKIFPTNDAEKLKLYIATWEGYLASSLYKELFVALREYYEYAIRADSTNYPKRNYQKGFDGSLAVHFALAYAHFDFGINDPLFDLFWKTPNEIRHYEFVSFIGRSCITRAQAGDEWFKENDVSKDKLVEFWNWAIATEIAIEPKAFSGFGFWINPDGEIIDERIIVQNLVATLQKSQGEIDWDYGLTRRLKNFAELDPTNTLEIIKHYLLLGGELNPHRRSPLFSLETEIKEALRRIFKVPTLKGGVEDLINQLIEKGSSSFWGLKEILDGE